MKRLTKVVILIGVVLFGFFFLNRMLYTQDETTNVENRAFQKLPQISRVKITQYPSLFERFFDDHFPFRNQMIQIVNGAIYLTFHESGVDSVLIGEDDWLFYNSEAKDDGDTISEYKRIKQYSRDELELFDEKLKKMTTDFEMKGIDFYLMIIPNKEEVYSEHMPSNIKRVEGQSSCDQLVNFLEERGNTNVIYPKQEMIVKKDTVRLYQKYDTHWNQNGAVIGVHRIEQVIAGETRRENTSFRVKSFSSDDGLSEMLNIVGLLEPEEQYYVPEYQRDDGSMIESENPINHVVFLSGDSFRNTLFPLLETDFYGAYAEHRDMTSLKQIDESKADVVILEFVERYIDNYLQFEFREE